MDRIDRIYNNNCKNPLSWQLLVLP